MQASGPARQGEIQNRLFRSAAVVAAMCLAAGVALAGETEARVYECDQGNQTTFSGQPCTGQERKIEVPYDQPTQAQVREAASQAQAEEADANAQYQQIQAREAQEREAQAQEAEAQAARMGYAEGGDAGLGPIPTAPGPGEENQ